MTFRVIDTTDSPVPVQLGQCCNLTVFNNSLAATASLSLQSNGVENLGRVTPQGTLTLDQNSFTGVSTIWVKSYVPGSPTTLFIWAW